MNSKLTNLLNKRIIFNICGWNISHILSHYIISSLLKLENMSQIGQIFILDLIWYLTEYILYKKIKFNFKKSSGVYENVYKPRLDNFVFNFIGIYLYIIINNKKMV